MDLICTEVSKSEVGEVVKTPGSFLLLEQELVEFAKNTDPRGLSECRVIGESLKMKPDEVEAASIFFDRQFTLLYFPCILPNLIFTRPQTPLHCIDAVVKLSYINVGRGEVRCIAEDMVSSLKDGIITEEILSHKELTQCFISDLYEPQHAIELLSHTFTLAPLSREIQPTSDTSHVPATSQPIPSIRREERQHLMMCLRSAIPYNDISKHLPPPSEVAPLVVQFTSNCVPLSCFSRTISCLMAVYDWKLSRADDGSPQCLAHNVVSLYKPHSPGQIVLVDTGHSIQVHIRPGKSLDGDDIAKICFQIKETIFTAIEEVFKRLHLAGIEATPAFFCPCDRRPHAHAASPFFFNCKWRIKCSLTQQTIGPASKHHLLWLATPVTETEKPSLPKLLKLDVVEAIGTNYLSLGTFLLKDDTGCLIDAIEHDCRQTHRITRKILMEWLAAKGEPATWKTLCTTLRDCKLNALADNIEHEYLSQ